MGSRRFGLFPVPVFRPRRPLRVPCCAPAVFVDVLDMALYLLFAVLCTELGGVAGDEGGPDKIVVAGDGHGLPEGPFDGLWAVLPKAGDGVVVGLQVLEQPYKLDVAVALQFQLPGRAHSVHVAVDKEL